MKEVTEAKGCEVTCLHNKQINKINRAQRHTLAYSWAGSQAQSWENQVLTHHALLPFWHEKIPRRPLGHCQVTAPPSSVSLDLSLGDFVQQTLHSCQVPNGSYPVERSMTFSVISVAGIKSWACLHTWSHVLSLLENPSLFVFPDEKGKVLIKHFGSIFTNDFPWGCTGPSDSFLTNKIQQKWLCHLRG